MPDATVRTADQADADLTRAEVLYLRGIAENSAGRPLRALRFLNRAQHELSGQADLGADDATLLDKRISLAMATAESELNGLESGLRALEFVSAYVERTDDDRIRVLLQLHLGYMHVRGGNFREGLDHLDSAVALLDHADPRSGCNILLNRGMLRVYLGDLARARADYRLAVRRARRYGLLVEEAKARHNLGEVEYFAGNLAVALRLMDEAAALEAKVSPAVALVDRARVLLGAGLHRDADVALVEAGELFRRDRLWKDVGEVELARAECALLDGEITAARRLAGSARDRFRRRGNARWRRDAELILLQADLAAGRPGSRIAPPAVRLAAEFRDDGLSTRARTAQLIAAEALLEARRVDQARELAATAGPVQPNDPIGARLHTRLVRAKLQLGAGHRGDSKREIRTGLVELARHQARFGSIDLQTASAVHGRQLAELDLSLALADGKPGAVLASVEQGRAISTRLQAVVAPQDADVAELLSELRQIAEELRTIESDPSATKRVSAQRKRVADIQQTLRSRAWQAEGSGQARKPATLNETLHALHRDASVFACFLEVGGQLHALVLGSGRPRVVALAAADRVNELVRRLRADLDVLADGRLPAALISAVTGSLNRSLNLLDELLIRPLGISNQRLVVAPTGTLATAPWGLLPSLLGCPVVVVPSASAWLAASSAPAAPSPRRIAVFVGPDLAFAQEEATAIAGLWPAADVYSGEEAGQNELRTAMTSANVVHIAAHGKHQAENPLFSSIRLADGPVFAYEFDQTARAAEHVILSSCELGQATIRPGDEALGLTSVLLHLGTRSVISGVARVDDQVAAAVMVRYHAALADGVDSAQALADACLPAARLPAPFVCFGSAWGIPIPSG
jgi:tetratricopeptide (TPR) repeat protein